MINNFQFWNVFLPTLVLFSLVSCKIPKKKTEGELLAERLCSGCHLTPKPSEVNKGTWNLLLPDMLSRMPMNSVTKEEQDKLYQYYIEQAPYQLPIDKKRPTAKIDTSLFKSKVFDLKGHAAATTFVKIDEKLNTLYFADAAKRSVFNMSYEGNKIDSFVVPGGIMDFKKYGNGYRFLSMGNFMPTDEAKSTYGHIPVKKDSIGEPRILVSDLKRATDVQIADLNGDNNDDFIISCFGLNFGGLSWYENVDTEPIEHKLNEYAGNIRTVVHDYNKDGLPDIYALVAQGDEKILRYENKGNGNFEEHTLLRFPPSYGSTYFNLTDINKDGILDILYVNGDNGDYTPIAKNYHGIRFYEGDEQGAYEELLFLPINGPFKAIVKDFDKDHDLDIAAIAYFPDYKNRPQEGFVFFENIGRLEFRRTTVPETYMGKWMVMDAGDIDDDGDDDIVIGSALFMTQEAPPEMKSIWRTKSVPLLVLENQTY
ncbi:FG-GAP repeat domain-containing protein [Flagellimonas sp.]|uniref:FG-GAP repeat domain-containing protein n=1 Tax=Flagellimonas sp. TaxID=2058762 RepID=UPI003B52A8EF